MKILWLSWKDVTNPKAGGAEVVMHELCKRLVRDGHSVTILTALYPGATKNEVLDEINIIRVGTNRYLHTILAAMYYIRNLRGQYDIVIEVVNTAPYMSPFYKGKAKSVLFYHQLARQIWFYEAPFPISLIGYFILEPVATFMLGWSKTTTITVSESTKNDLIRFHFEPDKIHIISEGITINPVNNLEKVVKYKEPTLLIFGAGRSMKRPLAQIRAFETTRAKIPNLKLNVAGDMGGQYGKIVTSYIAKSKYVGDINCLGRVSDKKKIELMQKSHVLLQASVKEGWCLVVTEAASQGTPAVVYDVDGLRDSVRPRETGIVCQPHIQDLASGVVSLLKDSQLYKSVQKAGWQWSKQITFDKSYKNFKQAIELT